MQRKSTFAFHGVSQLPVLVPAGESDICDGYATFARPTNKLQPVHVVRDQDFKGDWMQGRKSLSLQDVDFVTGAANLRKAYKENDDAMAREAYLLLAPFLKKIGVITEFDSESQMAEFYSAKLNPDGRMAWPRHHYQRLITHALEEVKVVWWWPTRTRSTLAFYCRTWKSALILATYLDRYRVCPCGKVFTPKKETTVCCCKNHTNYYRLKRWRDRKRRSVK